MTDLKLTDDFLAPPRAKSWGDALRPYADIARVDHWFKNAFMLLGVLIALFYRPELIALSSLPLLGLAVLATCLICSSNYTINEWLDAPFDRLHPTKRMRPAALGLVQGHWVYAQYFTLAAVGLACGFAINAAFGLTLLALWVMGIVYNVQPMRSKDIPYVDVLSESVNNPLRLMLGWFALIPAVLPPISLMLAYWMVGAFFMATKRFAEYRRIGDSQCASSYRKSFAHYNERNLLVSMLSYVGAGALFAGIFVVRHKLELILSVPFVAGFFAYYLMIGLKPDSVVQSPEKLYRERGFFAYAVLTVVVFSALMFAEIPALYDFFNVRPAGDFLWEVPVAGQ